jgi:hypothetical protein
MKQDAVCTNGKNNQTIYSVAFVTQARMPENTDVSNATSLTISTNIFDIYIINHSLVARHQNCGSRKLRTTNIKLKHEQNNTCKLHWGNINLKHGEHTSVTYAIFGSWPEI